MIDLQDIAMLALGLGVLIAGGELLVRGASAIALRLNISKLVVGLTIVAFGTSSPELFISVQSALKGSADMAMGNVVGSNICNLALVLGLTALLSNIPVERNTIRLDWPMAMGSALLLYAFVSFGDLGQVHGIIFLAIISAYVWYIVRQSMRETKERLRAELYENPEYAEQHQAKTPLMTWVTDSVFVLLGCAGLYYGSEWFVGTAEKVFTSMGVSPRVVGLMVLAVGTSLPELVTSVVAAYRKNTDLALGNLIGSNIFNILSILGITSILQPIQVSEAMKNIDIIWMLAITLLILPFMVYRKRIVRIHGIVLIGVYAYYVYSVLVSGA
jgi:cation:H+ antiporter